MRSVRNRLARDARSRSLLSIAGGVLLAAIGLCAQSAPRSVWDGVYTEEQAKRGAEVYGERCVRCHGETLMGGTDGAGALIGEKFNGNWNGVPLDQMIDRVRSSMPLDKPMTLSRQQTVDVMTYVFSANKIPAGKTELPRQAEMLGMIQYKAAK
jgi:mono/diheme cytochrome c family protein